MGIACIAQNLPTRPHPRDTRSTRIEPHLTGMMVTVGHLRSGISPCRWVLGRSTAVAPLLHGLVATPRPERCCGFADESECGACVQGRICGNSHTWPPRHAPAALGIARVDFLFSPTHLNFTAPHPDGVLASRASRARRASRSSSPVLAFSLRTSAVQPSIKLQVGQFNKRQLINMTCFCCCTATGQTQTDQQRANGPAVWPASPSPCLTHHQPMALPQFGGPLSLVLDPRRERAAPAQPTHPACCLTHQLTQCLSWRGCAQTAVLARQY